MAKSANGGGDDRNALLATIAALQAQLASAQSRGTPRKPGWEPKPVPEPKNGGRKGRFLAERVLDNGYVFRFYVGAEGKLTVSGTSSYSPRGIEAWGSECDTIVNYFASGMFAADKARIPAGIIADRYSR